METMTKNAGFDASKILRYPRLDTVLMVEEFIRKHSGEYGKKRLWESLPRKSMYQTFSAIIDYLEYSGKIVVSRDKKIVWIWNPELVKKYLSKPELSW
jgi:hypothetical protein